MANSFGWASSSGTVPSIMCIGMNPAAQNQATGNDILFDLANQAAGAAFMVWLQNFQLFKNGLPDPVRTQAAVAVMAQLTLVTEQDCLSAGANPFLFTSTTFLNAQTGNTFTPSQPNFSVSFANAKAYALTLN
jgi:hypothetical protein